ncbi:hypothetical protein [cf. Phormidesmis sp. LEGE 11477]|uniref:hypothetical protein n=1 Tax=cf. Phormidesmis sp. LEGE 11477 TaxID=1828680 RepID=UPI001881A9CB|nr:hypothetical protein [cf. Phormidesmis sp. LEGE 11477]MBE9064269.1 hypothetical protein [cf. Phormidesmis sp. LEGE 11477]
MQLSLTEENIDRAIAWYESHREEISLALPISVPGIKYKDGCLNSVDRYACLWREKDLALYLATRYLYRPTNHFHRAIEKIDKNKPVIRSKENANQ